MAATLSATMGLMVTPWQIPCGIFISEPSTHLLQVCGPTFLPSLRASTNTRCPEGPEGVPAWRTSPVGVERKAAGYSPAGSAWLLGFGVSAGEACGSVGSSCLGCSRSAGSVGCLLAALTRGLCPLASLSSCLYLAG